MGFKKYFLIGMLVMILAAAAIMIYASLTGNEEVAPVENITIIEPEIDEVLANFSTFNDPKFTDSPIYVMINAEGSDDVSVTVASVAIHNVYFDVWYVLNTEKRAVDMENPLVKQIIADAGVTYNEIYLYIPEVTVNVNGTIKNATMPLDKFYIYNEYFMLEPGQTNYIKLTFLKDKSVFELENGTVVFAPQIRIESFVNLTGPNPESGKLWMNITAGMNNNGTVRAGLKYTPE